MSDTVGVDRDVLRELVEVAKGKLEGDVSKWGPDSTGYDVDAFAAMIDIAEAALEDGAGDGESVEAVYREAIETWGRNDQIGQLGEECSELSAEVSRFLRHRSEITDVAAEAADVEVMLEQFRLIFEDEHVEMVKEAKIQRLRERLQEADHND